MPGKHASAVCVKRRRAAAVLVPLAVLAGASTAELSGSSAGAERDEPAPRVDGTSVAGRPLADPDGTAAVSRKPPPGPAPGSAREAEGDRPTTDPTARTSGTWRVVATREPAPEPPGLSDPPSGEPTGEATGDATGAADEPSEPSADDPSEAPSAGPTEEPTEAPTEAPTEEPTEDPTEEPTDDPTDEPTEGTSEAPADQPTLAEAILACASLGYGADDSRAAWNACLLELTA